LIIALIVLMADDIINIEKIKIMTFMPKHDVLKKIRFCLSILAFPPC